MKTVVVSGPGTTDVREVPTPEVGPGDVLVRMRACGICGSDAFYIARGGIPPREGATPLGHEPAGEVVEVGAMVAGLSPGDHVVVNPIASGSGMIGSGGPQGALSEFLLIPDAEV
jgi:threonine dehydrogenase-like Zn-dependent dehydrogenase